MQIWHGITQYCFLRAPSLIFPLQRHQILSKIVQIYRDPNKGLHTWHWEIWKVSLFLGAEREKETGLLKTMASAQA